MRYRVNLFDKGQLVSTELLDDVSLNFASRYVETAVVIGSADRAEVRRLNGHMEFQFPKSARD